MIKWEKINRKGVKNMGSTIGGMKNVKIFVLYLMQNVGRPLSFVTLNDIVMQTDFIMYLDFAEAFHKMMDDGLIERKGDEDGDDAYVITERGRVVAESLAGDILSSILEKSLAAALRYLDFKKRNIKVSSRVEKRDDGRYNVVCIIKENNQTIMQNTVVVDTINRAQRMEDNFRDHPEVVYKGVMALLSGNINFIFN